MAEVPPSGRNPFGPVDSSRVVAVLKAAGSFDPDVLYAAKQRMLAPYRDLRRERSRQSERSATTGSMRAARRAGARDATIATPASVNATAA
jgi:hypothetical protein